MRFPLCTFSPRITRRRSTRLTGEGFLFLLVTLAVGVAAINTGNNLHYLLLAMMLSIILMSGLVAEQCLRRLAFHRHVPDLFFAKEPATVTLVIKNEKARLPSFLLNVVEVMDGSEIARGLSVRQLLPGGTHLLSYPLITAKRGRLKLDGLCVATTFPFGLFIKTAFYPLDDTAIVCPALTPLDEQWFHEVTGRGYEHPTHRRGHGNDLYNLRQYHPGDDSRMIHWVSTARTSQLIIRETEAQDQRRVTVQLSTIAPASHEAVFEEAVSFTASVTAYLSRQGYHFRLVAEPFQSSFGQGETHLLALLQGLALCERRDPALGLETIKDPCHGQSHDGDGVLFVVQPWTGVGLQEEADSSSVVFLPAMFAKGPDVAR